ncbi:MAG: MazG-like family protein, partial [Candidatus Hodarchaeota archaeon]
DKVKKKLEDNNFTSDLPTLGLCLAEEAGEVAKAINQMNPKYKLKGNEIPYVLRSELHDCLECICAIANSAGIKLGI